MAANTSALASKTMPGGYEIRNAFSKCSSSPKDVTRLANGSDTLHIFEGFFDMLSFRTLFANDAAYTGDILVLNSAAFFERAKSIMAQYPVKKLWLDHNTTGISYTKHALSLKDGFQDAGAVYEKFEDLNDFLTGKKPEGKKQIKQMIS